MSTTFTLENVSIQGLAPRQAEALAHVALGRTAKEAARLMSISPRTVEMHLLLAQNHLNARNRLHLITQAVGAGMLAVREKVTTALLFVALALSSAPATQDQDPTDWARLQVRPARTRSTRRDDLAGLLPELV